MDSTLEGSSKESAFPLIFHCPLSARVFNGKSGQPLLLVTLTSSKQNGMLAEALQRPLAEGWAGITEGSGLQQAL